MTVRFVINLRLKFYLLCLHLSGFEREAVL
jgi:hypothetical protein